MMSCQMVQLCVMLLLLQSTLLEAFLAPTFQRHSFVLHGGGFGAGGAGGKKKKDSKLKPKQQWDRYTELKKSTQYRVAVQVEDEWLEVGSVKSQEDKFTEVAVAKQRKLIAEVRLVDSPSNRHRSTALS